MPLKNLQLAMEMFVSRNKRNMCPRDSFSIFSLYRACIKSFDLLLNLMQPLGMSWSVAACVDTEDDRGRFRVWAKSAGAHRNPRNEMSLDHKLHEASEVKRTVMDLLDALNVALKDGKYQSLR